MRLTSTHRGTQHHVTIPRHAALRLGTLSAVLTEVAAYLDVGRDELLEALFGR